MNIMDQLISTRYRLESDGSVTVYREQDVAPILDHNKAVLAEQGKGRTYTGKYSEGRLVASIPMIMLEKWKREEGFDVLSPGGCDMNRLRKKLNSAEMKDLRLVKGRL